MSRKEAIPVVDIFAGPGGLGEGFARCRVGGRRAFRSVLSIETDPAAHRTLTLRAFYRQFDAGAGCYLAVRPAKPTPSSAARATAASAAIASRHRKTTLYLEYLQLIAYFWPAVFVMENVTSFTRIRRNSAA